ncbi:hypothetical protein FACS189467_6740 [Bacteroidia bacterium]|nr:hypothetical protein FACS189467_6740 [Bacteroidia bacterium]
MNIGKLGTDGVNKFISSDYIFTFYLDLSKYILTFVFYLSEYSITFMQTQILQIQHLDTKMSSFASLRKVTPPPVGWLKAVRTTVGMSMQQLGNRMGITKQSVQDIERREQEGAITIGALREVANALDMQLVYGFVPKDGSLKAMINRKSKALAEQIVLRAANTMVLEQQSNSKKRIKKAIKERAEEIKYTMPKALWD